MREGGGEGGEGERMGEREGRKTITKLCHVYPGGVERGWGGGGRGGS